MIEVTVKSTENNQVGFQEHYLSIGIEHWLEIASDIFPKVGEKWLLDQLDIGTTTNFARKINHG